MSFIKLDQELYGSRFFVVREEDCGTGTGAIIETRENGEPVSTSSKARKKQENPPASFGANRSRTIPPRPFICLVPRTLSNGRLESRLDRALGWSTL